MKDGYWTIARWEGAPIRLHWTAPLLAVYIGGFSVSRWVALVVLILVHELGHAVLVRWNSFKVSAIDVSGFGGLCWYTGPATAIQTAIIAWGGVLAELALYAGTMIFLKLHGQPETELGASMVYVFGPVNLWMIAFNLIPIPPLDGAKAWTIIPLYYQRWMARIQPRPPASWQPAKKEPGPKDRSEGSAPIPMKPTVADGDKALQKMIDGLEFDPDKLPRKKETEEE